MEKINIAALLKDCPKGMELDCINYAGVVSLEGILVDNTYPIKINVTYNNERNIHTLTKYGQTNKTPYNKCIIFPKGTTTWEGFVPPCKFKDGDVVTCVFQGVVQGTGIFDYEEQSEAWIHVCINLHNEFFTDGHLGHVCNLRLATEEEKAKLFKAIKDNGYRWNAETKTLEKLVEPTTHEILSDALATFGAEHQRMMCMEECAELIDALAKYDRGRADAKGVITELADVSIMVEQMAMLFGKEEFEVEKERKLKRLQERINKDK